MDFPSGKRSSMWGRREGREAVGKARLLSTLYLPSLKPNFVLMLFLRIGNARRVGVE